MANLRRKAPQGMKTMREHKAGLKANDNIMQAKMKRISPAPPKAPLRKPPRKKSGVSAKTVAYRGAMKLQGKPLSLGKSDVKFKRRK